MPESTPRRTFKSSQMTPRTDVKVKKSGNAEENVIRNTRIISSCSRDKNMYTLESDTCSTVRTTRMRTCDPSRLSFKENDCDSEKSWKFHEKRRESQLNSMFRIRKQKLESISQMNRDIYRRLNTRESYYAGLSQEKAQKEAQNQSRFRTVDLQESRALLGPISSFNPSSSFYSLEKEERRFQSKQESSRLKKISASPSVVLGRLNNCTDSGQVSNRGSGNSAHVSVLKLSDGNRSPGTNYGKGLRSGQTQSVKIKDSECPENDQAILGNRENILPPFGKTKERTPNNMNGADRESLKLHQIAETNRAKNLSLY